jgi:hypothetical protein
MAPGAMRRLHLAASRFAIQLSHCITHLDLSFAQMKGNHEWHESHEYKSRRGLLALRILHILTQHPEKRDIRYQPQSWIACRFPRLPM